MTPLDLILWACAALIATIILMIPAMIVMMRVIEFRKRWRAAERDLSKPAIRSFRARDRDAP